MGVCTVFLLQKGISIFDVSSIFAISLVVDMIFEYPSGNLADTYGRKKLYALGLLFAGIQFLIYIFTKSLFLLYLAGVLKVYQVL